MSTRAPGRDTLRGQSKSRLRWVCLWTVKPRAPCTARLTLLPASTAHAGSLELRNLLGHLLRLLGRHRLVDDAQELLLVLVDEGEEVRVLLAQLLHQPSQRLQSQCALIDMCYA